MALSIQSGCISCYACMHVCPKRAVKAGDTQFEIISHRCDECADRFSDPQCASICPVENVITDSQGMPLNPTGSLSADKAIIDRAMIARG